MAGTEGTEAGMLLGRTTEIEDHHHLGDVLHWRGTSGILDMTDSAGHYPLRVVEGILLFLSLKCVFA